MPFVDTTSLRVIERLPGWRGPAAIVPSNVRHSVKALTDGRAIIVDFPLRRDFD